MPQIHLLLFSVPDVPHPQELLSTNRTMLAINLFAFGDGGCSMLYYVIEYRSAESGVSQGYQLVANSISPREKRFAIRGLKPGTRYFVKVTAHNSAG